MLYFALKLKWGMHEIIHYLDEAENDLYQDWLDSLRDRVAKLAIIKRNNRGQTTVSHFKRTLSFSRGAGFFN